MLFKSADDHSKRLALLESLQGDAALDRMQRDWLTNEIWAVRMGMSGERSAAHYIDHYYKDNPNLAVIHDLRLELDGEVAQIDHLLISRGMVFYLLETKNFSGHLHINAHGEFSVRYGANTRGIASPLEQGKRHEKVLARCLERLGITGRLGSGPQFVHAVLIDPKGTIQRPDACQFDTSNVIKADHFDTWRTRLVDKGFSLAQNLSTLMNIHASETVRDWAQKLVRQHRPLPPQQWLPDFMRSKAQPEPQPAPSPKPVGATASIGAVCATCAAPVSQAVADFCHNSAQRFGGLVYCMEHQKAHRKTPAAAPALLPEPEATARKLVCAACNGKITYAEAQFCWRNEERFGGLQYCRTHQAEFSGRA